MCIPPSRVLTQDHNVTRHHNRGLRAKASTSAYDIWCEDVENNPQHTATRGYVVTSSIDVVCTINNELSKDTTPLAQSTSFI